MDHSELAFAGIARQAELIAAGEISSRELVELYLQRIERHNWRLNAFRTVFAERALMEADQADARRRAGAGEAQRPLLGVPIAIKDDVDVAGEVTALGTSAYGEPAAADAEIVRRLRTAGAIPIGKTNVPELCAVPWTESPTWGYTRNPWNLQHTPGGSSGGSASAVAAGLVGAALGSDGGGSIRFPSAYCGLFGLKGQRGRIPLAPHLDACKGLSVNGLLSRHVADTALFYDLIAGGEPDAGAPSLQPLPPLRPLVAEGRRAIGPDGLPTGARLRIGVTSNLPPSPLTRIHADNAAALAESADLLGELGHEVGACELDHPPIAPTLEFSVRFMTGICDEAGELAHPERLERRMRTTVRLAGPLKGAVAAWARSREAAYAERMNRPFRDFDVLLMPVSPAPPPKVGRTEGRGWTVTMTLASATVPFAAPWNVTGQPAAAIPAGLGEGGLPRAVQIVGRPGAEATLIALAAQIEAARPWAQLRPPGFS